MCLHETVVVKHLKLKVFPDTPRGLFQDHLHFRSRISGCSGAATAALRYDNEREKGDHRHTEMAEEPYIFSTPDQLMADFEADITRWNHEHGRS